jgi:methyl-accepting chemotaxis protein
MLDIVRSLLTDERETPRSDGGVDHARGEGVGSTGPADGPESGSATDERVGESLGAATVLEALDLPAFTLDADGRVATWGPQMEPLIGLSRETVLGERDLGGLAYDADTETLAEKVFRAPSRAHEEFDGVGLAPPEYALLDADTGRVYEDTSTLDDRDLWFIAAPLYREGEFVGVLEIVQDRSDSARRRTEIEALFDELVDTIEAFGRGDFSARASFDREDTVLEAELLDIVDSLNEMGRSVERTVERIDGDAEDLVASVDATRTAAREIREQVEEQNEFLHGVQAEMQSFSANMEQVAASSEQIAAAVDDVSETSAEGRSAVREARSLSEDVRDRGDDLVDTVDRLGDRMADIEAVVDVIAEVADQTNMLALNANIEAARTEAGGDGFAVVADEIKDLADETRTHTEEIGEEIEALQSQVGETISAVETTHESLAESTDQVQQAAAAFERIDDQLAEAASGAEEIAEANDDQAATVQEVTASVDEAVDSAEDVLSAAERITDEADREHEAATDVSEGVHALASDR